MFLESGDNHMKGEGISGLIRTNGAVSYQQNSLVVPWDIELPSEQDEHRYTEDSGTCKMNKLAVSNSNVLIDKI